MKTTHRSYQNENDQPLMLALARKYAAEHLYVWDLPYRFSSWAFDDPENAHLWFDSGGSLLAWAVLQPPFWSIDITCRPDVVSTLYAEILSWADERARKMAATSSGLPAWYTNAFTDQADIIHALEVAGFANQVDLGENSWSRVFMRRPGDLPVKDYRIPPGFIVRSMAGEAEVEAYSELHRAVFGTKNMTLEWRTRTLKQPGYRPDLDVVVAAPDGRLAAFCVTWLHGRNGQIEPLGCHADFRRYALGRIALAEGLRRLQAAGAEQIYVETDNYRDTAMKLYEHMGFEVIRNVWMYRKDYMTNNHYTIQNHQPGQIDNLAAFFERYLKACPDAKLLSAGFYTYHPAAENGQNVFLVLDSEGHARGFAPVFPAPVGEDSAPTDPHHIWMIVLADPEVSDDLPIRKLLLEHVYERAGSMAAGFPSFRRTRLASDLMASQRADIAFLEQNGFERYDGVHVMQRPVGKPIPETLLPAGLSVRRWKLTDEAEQQQYLQAYNQGFPEFPKTLEALRYLLDSALWAGGAAISVFTPADDLIASILVYPAEQGFGLTDDVFVLPVWRGRGIARFLIGEGLKYFQERGITDLRLEVKQSNHPAVGVYSSMGYEVINEEVFLGRFL